MEKIKVIAKNVFFYGNSLYRVGDEVEINASDFDSGLMEKVTKEVKKNKKVVANGDNNN